MAQHNTMTQAAIKWLLAKIKSKSAKPHYIEDSSGDWYRHYIEFPDVGIRIQWMRYRSAEAVSTAAGSGYQSTRTVNMGDWKIPFKKLQLSLAWVQGAEDTNVWLAACKPQTETYGGSYYIKSNTAITAQKSYWVHVLSIGTF